MVKKFKVEKYGEFEVETKITFPKRNEIENIVARIYGGRAELTSERLKLEQQGMKLKEVKDVTQHVFDFVAYHEEQRKLNMAYKYATLKALVVSGPIEMQWLETDEEIDEVYTAYEKVAEEQPTEKDRYQKLLKEFGEMNFKKKKIELTDNLSDVYSEIFRPEHQWRHHYNYSLADPRYLEADQETIAQDLLYIQFRNIYENFELKNPIRRKGDSVDKITTEEDLYAEFESVAKRVKFNRNNYVSEEEIEEIMRERIANEMEYRLIGNRVGELDDDVAQAVVRSKMSYRFHGEIREIYDKFVKEHEKELKEEISALKELRQKEKIKSE